ncbi:hypothetical protein DPMN_152953 [Dreissena polymorpha]|uniref:Uncharacterized protein n=1 Tax=Dreissena polymorpha TaxID=45954 RepID=A0A9D4FM92_DREPO|nr:hypothetical protein DPMN_152953 [Dreissena polymorpha]
MEKKIYVTANESGKLITLIRDEAAKVTFKDPAFVHKYPNSNIHVTSTGRVFVFGSSVSQVDTDGKKVLNTIILDMPFPGSVYVNEDTSKMIVGLWNNDNAIDFKTKVT